jgi:DNA mismatch repair protein MSH4
MSDRSIQQLIHDVCSEISGLFRVSEAIATLDMLAAFSHLVTIQDYIRPELTDVLAVKAGRHPIKERIHDGKYVPNDAYAAQQSRFQIITGCNMSGKSTYIRSIALMTVMAHIGCFVPAQYASFPIIHQLFARAATVDEIESSVSTFAAEMREMSFILRNIEPGSMVIVDELGRGTSTTDGLAIAIAIAEALVESHAFVWFATHFRDLACIMAERSAVVNLHLAVQLSYQTDKMTMLYKIQEGYAQEKLYGLALAKLVPLPQDVLETAKIVSRRLSEVAERQRGHSKAVAVVRRRKLILYLKEQLLQAWNGAMEGDTLRKWLKRLQEQFILEMAAIDAEPASGGDELCETEREGGKQSLMPDPVSGGDSNDDDASEDIIDNDSCHLEQLNEMPS